MAGLSLFSGLIWFSLWQTLYAELDRDLAASAQRFEIYFTRESQELRPRYSPERLKDELEEFAQALPASDRLELEGRNGFDFAYPPSRNIDARHAHSVRKQFSAQGDDYT